MSKEQVDQLKELVDSMSIERQLCIFCRGVDEIALAWGGLGYVAGPLGVAYAEDLMTGDQENRFRIASAKFERMIEVLEAEFSTRKEST